MKKKLFSFTVLLSAVLFSVGFVKAQARRNDDWFQRQQQQQRALEQQRQQQMREMQRQQMRDQMRRDAQEQMRRKLQEQQRLQQQQMRREMTSRPGNVTPLRGNMNNRPGFTGRSTKDGRAVAVINNRMVAVPNARAGLRASNDNFRKAQAVRLTNAKRAAISAEVQKLATSSLQERVRTGGSGGLTGKFNSAAGGGKGGRSAGGGGRRGGNGGGDRSGGNGPSGPKKGDLTKTFNDAAGNKKKPPKGPTPALTPPPTPRGPKR